MTHTLNPSRVIGIQFSILSPEEIRKSSVANITSRDTYVSNKPVIGGIFDPRMGILESGLICPTDGHDYMTTPGYFGHLELARPVFYIQYLTTILKILRCICIKCSKLLISKEKYAHFINLDSRARWNKIFPIASKITRCGEDTEGGCGCKHPKKIFKEGLATIIAEWLNVDKIEDSDGNVKDKLTMKLTPEIVIRLFKRISDDDITFMGFSPSFSRPDWMVCQVLAIPPPAIRPSVKHDAQQRSEDDISHIIVNIIKANKTLDDKIKQNATTKVIDDWHTVLQYYTATMVDNKIPGVASVAQRSGRALRSVKERLVGKTGRVRGNLMGKRVDFSARSVITPDPNITIGELGTPLQIAKNITFPVKVNKRNITYLTKLVRNGPETYPGAKVLERKNGDNISLRYTDRDSIELMPGDTVHRHLLDGDPILFNRQPTLHRMSMMCHTVRVLHKGSTFRLNLSVTKPYNADFDGDEMNLHAPQDDESAAELKLLAAVPRQIVSPADNKAIVGIFQDSLLGSFRLSRKGIKFDKRHAMNLLMGVKDVDVSLFKNKEISSFELISQILPPMSAHFKNEQEDDNNTIDIVAGKYKGGQLDKAALGSGSKGLIQSIFNDYGFKSSADFIDNLQSIVTEYMKISSYSVGISDLIANKITNDKIAETIMVKKNAVAGLINETHIGTFENKTGKTNEIEFETQVNELLADSVSAAGKIGRTSLEKDNRFVIMVSSGSKGKNLNIAQMISCLGQQNVDGKRIPYGYEDRTLPHFNKYDDSPEARGFVESSFIQGLTPEELFFHAMGGRTGLIDTAVKTSQTGYIQRRLIKALEDIMYKYDGTVRNGKNKIIQFKYGDDNIDPMKVESMQLPLTTMTLEEIYSHFQIAEEGSVANISYTKHAYGRLQKQSDELTIKTREMVGNFVALRDMFAKHVFKYSDNTTINIPVHFKRIISNISNQLNYQQNSLVNITPLEAYGILDDNYKKLNNLHFGKPTELFKAAYEFFLSPKQLLTIHRFNQKGMEILCSKINAVYMNALCNPGDMVGMIAGQSIGEPTTQMSTIGDTIYALIKINKNDKNAKPCHKKYKIGELCDSFIEKYPQYTFPTGHHDSVETLLDNLDDEYYIMGVDESEKTSWSRVSHFSRHPVNGDMVTVTTKSGRKVTTTLSHSHLIRKDHKVQPIKGSDLEVGMRIPVCKHIDNKFVNKTVEIGNTTYELDKLFGWFIGAYIAEGSCNNSRINITNISQHYIDTTTIIGEMFDTKVNVSKRKGEYGPGAQTSFSSKELAKFLVKECGKNSFEKKVPDFIFTAPLECKAACIQGYMDGDGNINSDKGHHEIRGCSRSQQLVKDMGLLFNYFDIFATFHENVRQNKPLYHFAISNGYSNLYQEHVGSVLKADSLQEMCDYNTRSKAHSLSNDVDKIEGLGEIIAKCGKELKLQGQSRNYGRWKKKKTIGRRTLQKYIKIFKDEIKKGNGEERFLKEEMDILEQASDSGIIWDEIKDIEIYTPDQTKYVYDFTVPANQTFMEDNGVIVHNTLNTFHFAGVASKSNVTRGVPRIEEILSLSDNPKQPSTAVYLKAGETTNIERAQELKHSLEYTCLNDVTESVSICFDPDQMLTLLQEDKPLMEEYAKFNELIDSCGGLDDDVDEDDTKSKWIIRFELNKESMLDKNITMDDINFALSHSYKDDISCVYSDYNADKLVLRVRLDKSLTSSKKKSLDQSDEIYKLKNLQHNLLHNIILRGVKEIPKVILRKNMNIISLKDGNYEKNDTWVLDTVGSNLPDILTIPDIDCKKTYSNDIQEIYRTLGIEAARQSIFNEVEEAFDDTAYINYHHISVLCDRMTATASMVSVFRHGINNDDIGPIAKASFEETPEMFLRAARHAELDPMTGVSANVMCGQEGYFGTGSFRLVLDLVEMSKLGQKKLEKKKNIEELLGVDQATGVCSIQNITITGDSSLIKEEKMGTIDDDYDPGF